VVLLLETGELIYCVTDRLWRLWCGTVIRDRRFDILCNR